MSSYLTRSSSRVCSGNWESMNFSNPLKFATVVHTPPLLNTSFIKVAIMLRTILSLRLYSSASARQERWRQNLAFAFLIILKIYHCFCVTSSQFTLLHADKSVEDGEIDNFSNSEFCPCPHGNTDWQFLLHYYATPLQ